MLNGSSLSADVAANNNSSTTCCMLLVAFLALADRASTLLENASSSAAICSTIPSIANLCNIWLRAGHVAESCAWAGRQVALDRGVREMGVVPDSPPVPPSKG